MTVAKEIELKDGFENMGAQMLKEVAAKTSDVAGDGTTTATVLAQAIFKEGLKNVTAGANPMALQRGIDKAVEGVVVELRKLSKSTKDKKEIAQVATIAANNDKTIGDLISEAMEKVGKDGVITVEESKSADTVLDVVEGMQFDRGYLSPYFVTDAERMEVVLEDGVVLIHEKKLSVMKDMLPLLEHEPERIRESSTRQWVGASCDAKFQARSGQPGSGAEQPARLFHSPVRGAAGRLLRNRRRRQGARREAGRCSALRDLIHQHDRSSAAGQDVRVGPS